MAMVDSSVGGKTGVNHPLGKNMIGAFYQPRCVLVDVDTLKTLPDRELASGISEIVKYGLIRDPALFEWLEGNMERLLNRDAEVCFVRIIHVEDLSSMTLLHMSNVEQNWGCAVSKVGTSCTKDLHNEQFVLLILQAMTYAIERSCINKAEVVSEDEREGGVRATLNLGHTFGHAMETSQGYGDPASCPRLVLFLYHESSSAHEGSVYGLIHQRIA